MAEPTNATGPKKRKFCRRCLRWHTTEQAKPRLEVVKIGKSVALMDYVLCVTCFTRTDHASWYERRALDRIALGHDDQKVLRAIRCDEPIGSRGALSS